MQQKAKRSGKVIKQELKEREEVEKEINKVKSWIQEARAYLLNPTTEPEVQLEELQVCQTHSGCKLYCLQGFLLMKTSSMIVCSQVCGAQQVVSLNVIICT